LAHLFTISLQLILNCKQMAMRLTFFPHKIEYLLFAEDNCSFNLVDELARQSFMVFSTIFSNFTIDVTFGSICFIVTS
jgi:hypothetical protein